MKYVKKISILLFLSTCVFGFSSCSLLFDILFGSLNNNNTEEVNLKNKRYFVKYNFSNYDVSGSLSGYLTKSSDRSAYEDSESNILPNEFSNFSKKITYSEAIREIDNNNSKKLILNSSRAASEKKLTVVNNDAHIDEVKYFWYLTETASGNTDYIQEPEKGICKAVGQYCNVWFIDNSDLVSLDPAKYNKDDFKNSYIDLSELAKQFDSIYSLETKILGTHHYLTSAFTNIINPTEKIDIIVCDIIDVATENQNSGTYGYFSSTDMLINDIYNQDTKDEFEISNSNETHCIYIDSYFLAKAKKQVYSTLVHEFNHLLNYCNKFIVNKLEQETWYTEMLAMTAEDLFHNYLGISAQDSSQGRIPYFDAKYNYGFTNWRDGEYVFFSYANAFAFGAFLVRNYGGVDLLTEIATNNAVNFKSITNAVNKLNDTSLTEEDLLIAFSKAILNCYCDGDKPENKDYMTFIKTAGNKKDSNKLYFEPFSIADVKYVDANGKEQSISPYVFDYSTKQIDVGSFGFSIHNLPEGDTATLVKSSFSNLTYIIY